MEPGGEALGRRLQRWAAGGGGAMADPGADGALTFDFGWDLEEERWALKEDQKLFRSKAQKYLIETNRRRRAFEERRKQKEEKEQRLREQVLQQRRIKLQEATERFQRAHLPASQHKQIALVQTKAAFQLEEALEQIKGSVLTSGLYLPSRNKTTFRATDDTSSTSASRNGYSHQEQISAMVGCNNTMQESSTTSMDSNQLLFQKNLKEMQQLLEKQHLSNLENFHQEVEKTDDSESLSSLDSLEAGEQNGNCTPPSESPLTTQCDCAQYNPGKSQTRSNDLIYTTENTSKNIHLNNCQRNLDSQNSHNNLPVRDLLAKHNVLILAEHVNSSGEESSVSHRSEKKAAEFFTSGNQESSVNKAFTFLQNIKEERRNPSSGTASTLTTGHPVFSPSKAWASPDSIPGERIQDLMQEQSFKMTPQNRSKSVQTFSEPIATSGILFPNQRCSTGVPSTADTLPKDKNISKDFFKNTLGKVIETKEENIRCVDDVDQGSSLFQDASVLCNVKQQNNKEEEKANVVETMSLVSDTELSFGIPAQHKTLKNNIYDRKRAKLFRSILKKESKYEPSHFKAVVMNHGISFGARPVSSIRDSLELAKMKKKSAENEKNNRKLRWYDQINKIIMENDEKRYEKNTSEISSAQLQCLQTASDAPWTNLNMVVHSSNTTFTRNHQENSHISKPNVNSGTSNEECMSLNTFMSTGSSFAKKAWVVSKDEEGKRPVCNNKSKIYKGNQHKNKPKITRRPRPVRAQSGFMLKNRRGTLVQPQSATEANTIPAARGRVLVPYPPSAPTTGNTSDKTMVSLGFQPQPSSSLQAATTNGAIQHHVSHYNNSHITKWQPFKAPVSCITAGENSQKTIIKPSSRMNELFSFSANSVVPVTQQKQIFDNCEHTHRTFSEQRRQIVASKKTSTHHTQNSLHAVQLSPIQSAFDPAQSMNNTYKSEEVSESTAQFLMAEKLASTPAAEDEILAAMEGVQPARQPFLLNRAPCLGMSALSVEEEKIFQSLDRLNQRLQNVQEAITRNPSASGVLHIITPLSIRQSISSPLVNTTVTSQQYQNASASNQLQVHRKY
uniref:Centrosomal protein 126 n=1 Tax=Anser cygnoides TaxID=8845 RepID=A0A8B9E7L8_ANSCY|nr:centrosomal protein of 126 kDa isoform X3 [Anser cygnoides]